MKLSTLSQVRRSILITALMLFIPPIFSSLSAQEQEKNALTKHRLALVGGTIYPAPFERPITNGVVLVENRKIIEVDQPATPEEAVRAVDEHIAQGADIIKLFTVSPVHREGKFVWQPMPLAIVQAVTAEAHRKGRLAFAHPSTFEGAELVIRGHVDVLAHAVEDLEHWDNSLVARLKAANVSLIPTLTLFSGENGPDAAHEGILREVKSYFDAGGQILFGTDVGYLTDYPLLTRDLNFDQILAALTTAPNARFGFAATTGRVAVREDADLVVLNGDPAHDIQAFSRVALTLRSGNINYRAP